MYNIMKSIHKQSTIHYEYEEEESDRLASFQDVRDVLQPIESEYNRYDMDSEMEKYSKKIRGSMRQTRRSESSRVSKKKSDEIYKRLQAAEEKREENISRMKLEKMIDEASQCQFKPEIITKNRKNRNEKGFHERVDQMIKEKKEKLTQMKMEEIYQKEEEMKENCTFQPRINREVSTGRVKSKLTDISSWKKKFQDKLFEEYFDSQKEESTFKPKLSKKTIELANSRTPEVKNKRVEDRLFELSKKKNSRGNIYQTSSASFAGMTGITASPKIKVQNEKSKSRKRKTIRKDDTTRSNRTILTVDQLCASLNHDVSRISTPHNFTPKMSMVGNKKSKKKCTKSKSVTPVKQQGSDVSQRDFQCESTTTFGNFNLPMENSPFDVNQEEECSGPKEMVKRELSPLTEKMERENKKLLESLNDDSMDHYDPGNLTTAFNDIFNNPVRKRLDQFLPEDKCRVKKDGRKYMKLDGVKIYYEDSVLDDIINFGMRSRLSTS